MKTKLQIIIDTLKELNGKTTIDILLETLQEKHSITMNKRTLLTCFVRKTLKIEKPEKTSNIIQYVENPNLPEKYQELLINFRFPENMEDIFFLFVENKKYVPSYTDFKNYCENNEIDFSFNWDNRNIYHSMKKKVINMLKDCNRI